VHVDHEVGLGGATVERRELAAGRLADGHVAVGVLRVVVVEPVGVEAVEHPRPHGAPELRRGHAAVQRERGDQVDVVDSGPVGVLQHALDHALADVRRAHGRKRHGDVVESNGEAHAGSQQRRQRFHAERGVESGVDGGVDVGQALHGRRRVHHPRADRQALEPEAVAVVEERGRRGRRDLDHGRLAVDRGAAVEARAHALHHRAARRLASVDGAHVGAPISKTVRTPPERAARGAWSRAWRYSLSGHP
jgi:hypothetical protein